MKSRHWTGQAGTGRCSPGCITENEPRVLDDQWRIGHLQKNRVRGQIRVDNFKIDLDALQEVRK